MEAYRDERYKSSSISPRRWRACPGMLRFMRPVGDRPGTAGALRPLLKTSDDAVVTQFPMGTLEPWGC